MRFRSRRIFDAMGLVVTIMLVLSGIGILGRLTNVGKCLKSEPAWRLTSTWTQSVQDTSKFFMFEYEDLEEVFPELRNCGITVYANESYHYLGQHPQRTWNIYDAKILIFPPYMAWETNWPVYSKDSKNLVREGKKCGVEVVEAAEFVLKSYDVLFVVHEPHTSTAGVAYSIDNRYQNLSNASDRRKMKILLIDYSAWYNRDSRRQEWFAIDGIMWAKLNTLEDKWRPEQDISMPPPAHHLIMPVPALGPSGRVENGILAYKRPPIKYFLTFKGRFSTSYIREKLGQFHNPDEGIVIVDSSLNSSADWDYTDIMSASWFTLAVRGDNEFSYRFTESLCSGSIPVMVTDKWVPPFSSLIPFERYGVRILESELETMIDTLKRIGISRRKKMMREAQFVCQNYMATVEKQIETMLQLALQKSSVTTRER